MTGDLEHDLVQMPFVADAREPATDPVGELLATAASNSSTVRNPSGNRKI
jgi:hypothetical protein